MLNHTPLYQQHIAANAKLIDFSGWEMPIHYGSQLNEHHSVRKAVGMFDVSHMTIVDIKGSEAKAFLRYLLANDVEKLTVVGQALYSALLNEQGGILDDLLVYRMQENNQFYRLVVNCATRTKDLAWIIEKSQLFDVEIVERADLCMLAVQGPKARIILANYFRDHEEEIQQLAYYRSILHSDKLIACTGYTGEDGFEIMAPAHEIIKLWNDLLSLGVQPCGLGARDTLRLEAGMNLYGTDMDESTTPYEVGMGWTVALLPGERDFIGRIALEKSQVKPLRKQVGVMLSAKAILRSHQIIYCNDKAIGEITSGSFSPTIEQSIGLARILNQPLAKCEVEIRGKRLPIQWVKPPFVRLGKIIFKQLEEGNANSIRT